MAMMVKIFLTVVVIAVVAFFVKSYVEEGANRRAQEAEQSRQERRVQDSVMNSAERHDAITDWEMRLGRGERYRLSPILTIELEQLWRNDRPILFVGSIKDISSVDVNTYSVLVEQSLYTTDFMFSTELRLSLTAQKSVIDTFLEQHPELLSGGGFQNGVAVIAKIDGILSNDELTVDGERVDIKTGTGKLLDVVYTGSVLF